MFPFPPAAVAPHEWPHANIVTGCPTAQAHARQWHGRTLPVFRQSHCTFTCQCPWWPHPGMWLLWCHSLRGHVPCTKIFTGFEKKVWTYPFSRNIHLEGRNISSEAIFLHQNWMRNILAKRSIWQAYMASILWHPKHMQQSLEFVYETCTCVNWTFWPGAVLH